MTQWAAPSLLSEKKKERKKKEVMFNLQAEIKGPGSAEEAGNMKGDDVIVHTQPFLIVSPPPPSSSQTEGFVF